MPCDRLITGELTLIRPFADRILVKPVSHPSPSALWTPSETTTFATYRANTPVEAETRGEVVSLGPQVSGVQVGDMVQFSDSCGRPVNHDGARYLFIRQSDVALIEG